jgi:acetate CoA/acetoacetate CoA-transferase alpha subunit
LISKVVSKEDAIAKFQDGQTIMFGDWHGELSAEELITGVLEKGTKDICAIAVSGGMPDQGVGRLIHEKQVKQLITTHIGLNPEAKDQMFAGELDVEFVPQGTFAERIRCGGAGLGGCLTPTGVGTDVEKGKEKLTINGKEYLLELPLHADIALIKAWKADTIGNIAFRYTGRATNSYMALAADLVIVEVEELVEVGELEPDQIDVPAPIIDMVYVRTGEKKPFCPMWQRAKAKAEKAKAEGGGK